MAAFASLKTSSQVHFAGNSWTGLNYFSRTGGIVDQINAAFAQLPKTTYAARLAGGSGVATLAPGAFPAIVQPTYQVSPFTSAPTLKPVTSAGFSGNNVTTFVATVAARITNFNPDFLFFETGANDEQSFNNGQLTVPQYTTAMTSVINQCLTFNPAMGICILSCMYLSAQWSPGPSWVIPSNTMLSTLQGICAGYSNVVCVDCNTPALAYVVANNAPSPGVPDGILTETGDNVHPNALGCVKVGNWTMPYLRISY